LLKFRVGEEIKEVSADLVVLTIPCSVFTDIEIDFIPAERLKAIREVHYGINSRILFPFPSEPLTHEAFGDGRAFAFLPRDFQTLCLYYIGEHANFTAETIETIFDQERPLIPYFTPYSPPPPVLARDTLFASYHSPVGHSWPMDPFAKGSYSCIAP